ncbi:MAG: lysophospholipid acyltransferase family protein [Thermoanaerobaculia bacterium]
MLRIVWVGLVALVATLVTSPLVILFSLFHASSATDGVIRLWARSIVNAAGIELRSENLDRIRSEQRYIIVGNHYSYLDIPVLLATIPQPVRFMAKASLFQIPLFGWGLKSAGFIPIDRKRRSRNLRAFELAGERIRKGNTIVIFPEEGRSRSKEMKPFQRGAYLLALKSELPILPVAIDGTYEVLPATRLSVHPGVVTVHVSEPIETTGLTVSAKKHLMETTRERIGKMLFGDQWSE